MEADDIEKVIAALDKIPETHLRILDLAREMVTEDGLIDYDMLAAQQPEVNLAVAEAQAYSRSTKKAIESLDKISARKGSVDS